MTIEFSKDVATFTGISWPFLSFAFTTSNTDKTEETTIKRVESTK